MTLDRGQAEFLLRDLARWVFGALLADKGAFAALSADELSAEVRAYRYGILCAILKDAPLRERALAEPIVAAPWELMQSWEAFGSALQWAPDAELALAERFESRLKERQGDGTELSAAMRRFARGKAFKYGRRVLMLSERIHAY